ncbi:Redox-sensitive transcriptional activator SoxR [Pseudovibrio sp. W64]|uniref:hypothetical protein n=1 Tax=Pseudovibrio sp. W64 TaxID=1735583 RepID=UPI0007B223E1|nr:hypothetical protein [Pseudovibrio sp. W64]KZK79002.1 Redox-sensitive transcriptional activator SoxR [Pseudovibrio sp. W64]
MAEDIKLRPFLPIKLSHGGCNQLGTLPPGRAPNKAEWQRLSQQFKVHLNERIARMENLRTQLEGCMGCGCLSLDKCELYNAGDAGLQLRPRPPLHLWRQVI